MLIPLRVWRSPTIMDSGEFLTGEQPLATEDTCCTIVPYLQIRQGRREDFVKLCREFVEKTAPEPKCLFYGWSFDGDLVHCREGYADAEALLYHLDNIALLLTELFKISDITRLEVHGPARELAKLRQPLSDWNPKPRFFTLEYGFRR
jgi:hypothetical protein